MALFHSSVITKHLQNHTTEFDKIEVQAFGYKNNLGKIATVQKEGGINVSCSLDF